MLELLQESIAPANIIYTALLGFAVLYALSAIIGFVGMDAIDFDVDADVDVDVDSDVDVNGAGVIVSIMAFFNLGKIPFMFLYAICTLFMWIFGMLLNVNLGNGQILFTVMTFVPVLFVSLVITKFITTPFIPFFKNMNEGAAAIDYIGMKANLLMSVSNENKSQAEVMIEGESHRITVALKEDNEVVIPKGTDVYITGVSEDASFYWVAKDDII